MSSNSVLNAVQHYQRSIEKNPADVARLLHCVGKLYKIPITVELLQQTGVGRTVNGLRKYDGELSVAAEAVVNKWKQLVATENDTQADNQSSGNEHDSDDDEEKHRSPEKNDQRNIDETVKAHSSNNNKTTKQYSNSANETEKSENNGKYTKGHSKNQETVPSSSSHKNHEHSKHKSDRTDKSKDSKKDSHKREEEREHKSHSKSQRNDKMENAKDKTHHNEHKRKIETEAQKTESNKKERTSKENLEHHNSSNKKHKHHDKYRSSRDKEKSNSEQKVRGNSPSSAVKSERPSTSTAVIVEESAASHTKRRHEDVDSEKESLAKKPKSTMQQDKKPKPKSDQNEGDIADDGIDSSMGANFADVLGMLNMPKKKAKKSLNALKNTSPKSTQKTPESDKPKSSSSSKTNDTNRKTEMPTSSTSQNKLEKKPELLTSKAKLPPLDPSIVFDLPVISNNYKPLPLNPMVMECVFNSTTSSSSRAPPPRLLSDAEALSHGFSSKTMRTKVYSGVKTGQLLQVPSLFGLCIRILQKNIDALEYTGGVPFDVLRSVLERATPQQLFNFEEYNPYVMEDSDVLWKLHVERNYRGHKRQEMESWREMFMRCQEDQERRLSMLAENIKQSQKAIALPVRKTQLAFVDSMVKPPRNVIRKQEQHGTKSKLVATPAARVAALSNVTPNAAKQGDARLRVAAAFSQDPVKISNSFTRPKKAPLMAKTLQFMRGRLKR